jgi:hypothetical protein
MTDRLTSSASGPGDIGEDDERAVAAFMLLVASLPAPSGVTDPARLWWRAQLLKKWEAERRAERPLDVLHPIEIAGGIVAASLMLYWSLPYLF